MSIQNIKINNLIKNLNDLETIVANLQIGGAPVISGNIDMNNNDITELKNLVFNTNDTVDINAGNLEYNNSVVVTAENISQYETANGGFINLATSDLNMQNHSINSISSLTLSGSGIINLPYGVANQLQVRSTDSALTYQSNEILTEENLTNFLPATEFVNIADDNLNMTNHNIQNISSLSLSGAGVINFPYGSSNQLQVGSDDILRYQNNEIVTSANFDTFQTASSFVGTANADLNMANFNIRNASVIEPDNVNFGGNTNNKLTVLNGDLEYQGDVVITSGNYTNYITSDTGFVGTATTNLNMSNYDISNVGNLTVENLNFNGQNVVLQSGIESEMHVSNEGIQMTNNQSVMLTSNTYPSTAIDFNGNFTIELQEFSYTFTTSHNYMLSIDIFTDSAMTIPAFGSNSTVVRLLMSQFLNNNEYTGSFSFNKNSINSNIIVNNLGITPTVSSNYTISLFLEMDGVSDLINGDAIIYLKFSSPIDVPITLSLIDEKLNYNGTELIDVNSLPSSIVGPQNMDFIYLSQNITNLLPFTVNIPLITGTSLVTGTIIGSLCCVQFTCICIPSTTEIIVTNYNHTLLMDDNSKFDSITFGTGGPSLLSITIAYENTEQINDFISVKINIFSTT
jgi:hypothetical protein